MDFTSFDGKSFCPFVLLCSFFYYAFSTVMKQDKTQPNTYVIFCSYILKQTYVDIYKAAWYPDKPTLDQEQKMTQFMEALALFYPCTYCATDFQMNLKISPVR